MRACEVFNELLAKHFQGFFCSSKLYGKWLENGDIDGLRHFLLSKKFEVAFES